MDVVQEHRMGQFAPLVIGYCCPGTVDAEFLGSMCDTLLYDNRKQQLVVGPAGGIIGIQSSPRIAETRSRIVDSFLQSSDFVDRETGFRADWLLMVDADMRFTGEDVYDLLASADPIERPVVGGLCFAGGHTGIIYPTLYTLTRDENGIRTAIAEHYTPGEMHKVGGTGAAFLLMHRSALVKMGKAYEFLSNGVRNPYPWFVEGHIDAEGNGLGEDISFCLRLQACGIPLYVNTNVRIGHMKRIDLNEKVYNERNRRTVH